MIVPFEIIEGSSKYSFFKKGETPCAEVQISIEFIKIVATDIIINLVKHPVKYILFMMLADCKTLCTSNQDKNKKGGTISKKAELDISEVRRLGTTFIFYSLSLAPFIYRLCYG